MSGLSGIDEAGGPATAGDRVRILLVAAAFQLLLLVPIVILAGGPAVVFGSFQTNLLYGLLAIMVAVLMVVLMRYVVLVILALLADSERLLPDKELTGPLPRVSVIVPAYNEEKVIEGSIRSLLNLDYPDYEIIVIDDGSSDDTYMVALSVAHGVDDGSIRVLSQRNGGKASALNNGIRNATGDFCFCMDADSTIAPETLRACVGYMADPHVAAVAGAVKVVNTHTWLTKWQYIEYIQGLNIVRKAMGFGHAVNIIPGPVGFFRRQALFDVGLYDSDTFAEDCDLTLKLIMRGWRVAYEPRAQAFTEAPETVQALFSQRYRWTRGILQAVLKHRRVLWQLPQRPLHSLVLWYMIFESLVWPITNVLAQGVLIYVAFAYGVSSLLLLWWGLLTILDLSITLVALLMEGEPLGFLPHSIPYRMFFILLVDFCKMFATIEEFLGVGMSWGKLKRIGRI